MNINRRQFGTGIGTLAAAAALGRATIGVAADGPVAALPRFVSTWPFGRLGNDVDNEVGAAGATGTGENVMRYCASFMIVEAMRHGMGPQAACVAAIRRIAKQDPRDISQLHINFIAIDKQGNVGAAGTDQEFKYAVTQPNSSQVLDAEWVT